MQVFTWLLEELHAATATRAAAAAVDHLRTGHSGHSQQSD